jgi:hypothetical protein
MMVEYRLDLDSRMIGGMRRSERIVVDSRSTFWCGRSFDN